MSAERMSDERLAEIEDAATIYPGDIYDRAMVDGLNDLLAEVARLRQIEEAATAFTSDYYADRPHQDSREALRKVLGIANECIACKGSGCSCHPYGIAHPPGLIGWSPCRTCGGTGGRAALPEAPQDQT